MSDIILRSSVRAHVELARLGASLERMIERVKEQDGQDTIEYLGVLIVVAAVITLVATVVVPKLGTAITSGANKVIGDVFNS